MRKNRKYFFYFETDAITLASHAKPMRQGMLAG
jgi:hypothetical protein